MTWVRIESGFCEHPKIEGLNDYAFRLIISAICYSSRNLTDGKISRKALRGLVHEDEDESASTRNRRFSRAIDALTESGVLSLSCPYRVPTASLSDPTTRPYRVPKNAVYEIHDYLDYQPAKSDVERKRATDRERLQRWRSTHRNAPRNDVSDSNETLTPSHPIVLNPTVVGRAGANGAHGGDQDQGKSILPKRLLSILDDKIADALTRQQAEVVAAAWQANDVELRQSMAKVESAANPAAYLVSMCQRITGARA